MAGLALKNLFTHEGMVWKILKLKTNLNFLKTKKSAMFEMLKRKTVIFSVVDIVEMLMEIKNPRRYWSDLKIKLDKEGSQLYDSIVQLKMLSSDGKMYKTDTLSTKNVLRLIQSIPSPKVEPFKMWLVQVENDLLEEYADPEKAITRGVKTVA